MKTPMHAPMHALVVEDEQQVRSFVAQVLNSDGWNVSEAASAEEAFALMPKFSYQLVFCDVLLGDVDGYEVLRRFTAEQPDARFVLMTGKGSAAGALDATAIGAFDYLLKPFTIDDILNISALIREHLRIRSAGLKKSIQPEQGYTSDIPLIGNSPKFVECLKMVGRVAPANIPVLISGESGTGKEIIASAIHRRSSRASGPFVTVNCGAIPVELIESELFGHVRGSFTGAAADRVGLWEQANNGTILLDEVTETSPLFQVKLLRTLQEGEIRRVGSNRTTKVDVRVIAATNRNIETEVAEGRFRQDLMYRLNAVNIQLPPLRERLDDIPLLAAHFSQLARQKGAPELRFSSAALEMLKRYPWPGNVRELENAVLHATSMSDDVVYPEHLPDRIREFGKTSKEFSSVAGLDEATNAAGEEGFPTLAEMQAAYVSRVLEFTGGNKQAASRILNIDRKTLSRIMERREK